MGRCPNSEKTEGDGQRGSWIPPTPSTRSFLYQPADAFWLGYPGVCSLQPHRICLVVGWWRYPTRLGLRQRAVARTPFQLLMEASGQARRPSFWCLWNWVNVMDWQLTRLHDPDCPAEAGAKGNSAPHPRPSPCFEI